jgi:hypothetical protein
VVCENEQMSDLIHEKETTAVVAPVVFSCLECRGQRRGHVLVYERKIYCCLIPLSTERQTLVRCETCGAQHQTVGVTAQDLAAMGPGLTDQYITKIKSPLFPKLLIVVLATCWWMPLVGPFVWWFLRSYRDHVRGRWRRAQRLFLYGTIVAHVFWIPYFVYMTITEQMAGPVQ